MDQTNREVWIRSDRTRQELLPFGIPLQLVGTSILPVVDRHDHVIAARHTDQGIHVGRTTIDLASNLAWRPIYGGELVPAIVECGSQQRYVRRGAGIDTEAVEHYDRIVTPQLTCALPGEANHTDILLGHCSDGSTVVGEELARLPAVVRVLDLGLDDNGPSITKTFRLFLSIR